MSEAHIHITQEDDAEHSLLTPDIAIDATNLEAVDDNLTEGSVISAVKNGIAVIAVGAEVLPANEVIRASIYAGAVYASGNSLVTAAAAAGLSTFAIEGAASIAAARLLTTNTSDVAYRWVNGKLRKVGINDGDTLSTPTKALSAFLGGSVVTMALERREKEDISKAELRKYGLKVSAALAGALTVLGAAASEGIDLTKESPVFGATIAASIGALALGKKYNNRRKIRSNTPELLQSWRIDSDKYGLSYGLVEDELGLKKAAKLEQDVWDEKEYGNLEEEGYTTYIKNSRTFAAFDTNNECIGMNRMFQANGDELPPFLDMEFYDEEEKSEIAQTAASGDTEELGTVAVSNAYRGKRVNLRLWRMAYRDARERGIKQWGIIMEPERVEKMNKYQGFTFRQLGPAVPYQGGDCAPFIMDLQEVDDSMSQNHKLNYFWFVKKKLKR